MPSVRTFVLSRSALAFALGLAACSSAPTPVTVEIAPPAALPSASVATAAPTAAPTASASARDGGYRWICHVGHSGGEEIFVAVKDDGATWEIAMGETVDGPFRVIKKDNGTTPERTVVTGAPLADPDLAHTFEVAGVKAADVASMTVYSVFIRGGWSLGLATFADKSGKHLGQSGYAMRVGNGRACPAR